MVDDLKKEWVKIGRCGWERMISDHAYAALKRLETREYIRVYISPAKEQRHGENAKSAHVGTVFQLSSQGCPNTPLSQFILPEGWVRRCINNVST